MCRPVDDEIGTLLRTWQRQSVNGKVTLHQSPVGWSHFLRQPVKVASSRKRMIHYEDAETVFGCDI